MIRAALALILINANPDPFWNWRFACVCTGTNLSIVEVYESPSLGDYAVEPRLVRLTKNVEISDTSDNTDGALAAHKGGLINRDAILDTVDLAFVSADFARCCRERLKIDVLWPDERSRHVAFGYAKPLVKFDNWGLAGVPDSAGDDYSNFRAERPGVIEPRQRDSDRLVLHVGSYLGLPDPFRFSDGGAGSLGSVHSFTYGVSRGNRSLTSVGYGSPNQEQASQPNDNAGDGRAEHGPSSPHHPLLGAQIVLGALACFIAFGATLRGYLLAGKGWEEWFDRYQVRRGRWLLLAGALVTLTGAFGGGGLLTWIIRGF